MKLNPKWRNFWGISLLVLLSYLAVADVYPALAIEEGATLSEFMHAHTMFAIPLAYLAGHFWPIKAVLKRLWEKPNA